MSSAIQPPRTYNQNHIPRNYIRGKRRVSIYWTWSYPWESNRDVTQLDNRFSTITEVRRTAWPDYEGIEYSANMFLQGIAGTVGRRRHPQEHVEVAIPGLGEWMRM